MSAPENPHAFPFPDVRDADGCGIMEGSTGMTLRDWFAGQALGFGFDWTNVHETGGYAEAAQVAYDIADAMLAAREQKG